MTLKLTFRFKAKCIAYFKGLNMSKYLHTISKGRNVKMIILSLIRTKLQK